MSSNGEKANNARWDIPGLRDLSEVWIKRFAKRDQLVADQLRAVWNDSSKVDDFRTFGSHLNRILSKGGGQEALAIYAFRIAANGAGPADTWGNQEISSASIALAFDSMDSAEREIMAAMEPELAFHWIKGSYLSPSIRDLGVHVRTSQVESLAWGFSAASARARRALRMAEWLILSQTPRYRTELVRCGVHASALVAAKKMSPELARAAVKAYREPRRPMITLIGSISALLAGVPLVSMGLPLAVAVSFFCFTILSMGCSMFWLTRTRERALGLLKGPKWGAGMQALIGAIYPMAIETKALADLRASSQLGVFFGGEDIEIAVLLAAGVASSPAEDAARSRGPGMPLADWCDAVSGYFEARAISEALESGGPRPASRPSRRM